MVLLKIVKDFPRKLLNILRYIIKQYFEDLCFEIFGHSIFFTLAIATIAKVKNS